MLDTAFRRCGRSGAPRLACHDDLCSGIRRNDLRLSDVGPQRAWTEQAALSAMFPGSATHAMRLQEYLVGLQRLAGRGFRPQCLRSRVSQNSPRADCYTGAPASLSPVHAGLLVG